MKKVLNVFKKHKALTFICLVIAVLLVVALLRPQNPTARYAEDIVAKRDIVTYNSFVGNVGFTNELNALSKASAQILEVFVEVGDAVSKGDAIARLDSETIEYNISQKELALKNQKIANEYALADAQRAYDNFKYTLDNGLNSTLNNVKNQKTSAEENLEKLTDSFNDYIDALEVAEGNAHDLVNSRNEYRAAVESYDRYKLFVDKKKAELDASENMSEEDIKAYEIYLSNFEDYASKVSLKYADYEKNVKRYGDGRDVTFKTIVDNLDAATTAYKNACEAYDSVKLQLDQQLASYEAALNKAKDTLSLESGERELQNLKDALEDYTVTAPCDGIITSLNLTKGNMTSAGTVAATISNLDELEITIKVDEYSVLNTKVGKEVEIYIDSIERTYTGTITWLANNATIANGVSYFEATVEFNADEYVRGGMSVEVRLVRSESLGAISLSVDAVNYRKDNTAFVYVMGEDGELVEKNVLLGVSDGIYIEITEGLSEGDSVMYVPSIGMVFPMMGTDFGG